jgi:prepilin-type N-terminal cleavage/methylation domain-containing protein
MPRASDSDCRSGFTLLEVMVALGLLTGAFLAVAQLLMVAARATESSRATTLAANLAAQKVECLRSLAWGYDIAGVPTDELEPSPPGSLVVNTTGFVDYLDDAGVWIGSGPSPPPRAMFVRRWSVEADVDTVPPTVLMLRVVVLRRGVPSAVPPGDGRSWIEMTRVLSARARRPS